MEDLEFFWGRKEIAKVEQKEHRGKAVWSCSVEGEWYEHINTPFLCGNSYKKLIRRKLGLTQVESIEKEGTISFSLLLGEFFKLGSELKRKLAFETRWEKGYETEDELSGTAPKCGRMDVRYYQYRRLYNISYRDQRFFPFKKRSIDDTIVEWTSKGIDLSLPTEIDPWCHCKEIEPAPSNTFIMVVIGELSKAYLYRETDKGVEIPELGILVPSPFTNLVDIEESVSSNLFPEYIRSLSGITEKETVIRFRRFREEWITPISPLISFQIETGQPRKSTQIQPLIINALVAGGSVLGGIGFWLLLKRLKYPRQFPAPIRTLLSLLVGTASAKIVLHLIKMYRRQDRKVMIAEEVRLRAISVLEEVPKNVHGDLDNAQAPTEELGFIRR